MGIGRAVTWWEEWISAGHRASPPGWLTLGYRRMRAWIRGHAGLVDAALAVVVAAATVPQLVHHARDPHGSFGTVLLFSVLLVAPLTVRRRYPLSAFAFAAAVAFGQWFTGVQVAADLSLLIYLYAVTSRYPLRVALLAAGVLEVGTLMGSVRWPQTGRWPDTFVLLSGPVLAALLLGLNVRHQRGAVESLTQRAAQLERDRDQQAVIAAVQERTRIAREMHDIVAHSLSVMVTLADGAAGKQAREPERAGAAMRQVSATGRQALDEMRRLLGLLRTDDAGRQPQPGVAQLDTLLDQVRATGLAATLTLAGTPTAVSPGEELTVYRIVQEAVTNTLKHAAAPTRVDVALTYADSALTVDVCDDGAGTPRTTAGHGLAGMRERAAVYGGTVTAGPDPDGGWRVRARLPVADPAIGSAA